MALGVANGGMTGYARDDGSVAHVVSDVSTGNKKSYWSHSRCKRAYNDYLTSKRLEISEQQEARRYRHGAQWTSEQIGVFNKRKQPVVTYNRISRKIDSLNGHVEKLRAEPKAFPRSPRFQQGADLATAALRSCLEQGKWKHKTPKVTESAAVDGLGGVELLLEQRRDGSYDVGFEEVDSAGFFYDPRSKKEDFSDARYMGMGKWVDVDTLKDTVPGKDEEIDNAVGHGSELTSNSDSDATWFMTSGDLKSVRLVYICYQHKGGWCWALFTGASILMEGESYFVDRDGKTVCSFIMFSAAVDHDNDRYGFVRNLKSPQDEINQRRSKGLHELNTRRLIAEKGAFDDIERTRMEAVKPDGVIERNKGYEAEFDDAKKQQDIVGQMKFLEDAKAEIENFGPNPALMGSQGISNRSGKAIALMQQAGFAELGPYIIGYKNWKLRVYEAVFFAIKKYWRNERWIMVSDEEGEQQMVQLNSMQVGPMGMPQIVNSIGELDVEIVLDEGPDTVTMMEDLFETLSQIVPAIAPMLSPPEVRAVVEMLIETSPMTSMAKKRFRMASQQAQQPNPAQQQMEQLQLAGTAAQVDETKSKTMLNMAKAQSEGMPEAPQMQPQEFQLPPEVQVEQALAGIHKTRADAAHKLTLAQHETTKAKVVPFDYVQKANDAARESTFREFDAMQRSAEFSHNRAYDIADLALRKKQIEQPRPAAK